MAGVLNNELRIQRKGLVLANHEEAARADRQFWHAKTPEERLRHLEALRELNYGPEVINQGLQRLFAVLERPKR